MHSKSSSYQPRIGRPIPNGIKGRLLTSSDTFIHKWVWSDTIRLFFHLSMRIWMHRSIWRRHFHRPHTHALWNEVFRTRCCRSQCICLFFCIWITACESPSLHYIVIFSSTDIALSTSYLLSFSNLTQGSLISALSEGPQIIAVCFEKFENYGWGVWSIHGKWVHCSLWWRHFHWPYPDHLAYIRGAMDNWYQRAQACITDIQGVMDYWYQKGLRSLILEGAVYWTLISEEWGIVCT